MNSSSRIDLVYQSLLHTEMLQRYYGHLAHKLERRETTLSVLSVVLASGAVLLFFSALSHWFSGSLILLSAVIQTWLSFQRLGKKSLTSSHLQTTFSHLTDEWKLLWAGVSSLPQDEIERRWRELQRQGQAATATAKTDLPQDGSLIDRSTEEAWAAHGAA